MRTQSEPESEPEGRTSTAAGWATVFGCIAALLGAVNSTMGVAMATFDIGVIPALLVSIVIIVVSIALLATIIGAIIWMFIGSLVLGALFGVPPLEVNLFSFYLAAGLGGLLWGAIGAALGFGVAWSVSLVRGRRIPTRVN